METVNGVTDVDKGGPPPPSPLTGCYLLIVVGEPHSEQHKDIILQRIAKGLLSWDLNDCLVDLEKELAIITEQALEGEEARYGERLIQFASENLVTEILIHPVVSTLAQCMRNLLSSFTRHRHIIHAGYTFAANGSWALQDGTFSSADFSEAFQELEVQRVIRAYENGISLDLHCSPEGDWSRIPKEHFAKACKVRVNPTDVLTSGSPSITEFINYISPFLLPTSLENLLESSDVVGNIRFSRPTLYVFPGGQGDAALFGINGFNMLLDGGFSRKACFWDFVRHLDRLDAVLMTRLNNSNVGGISSVLRRKKQDAVYPQIGHFFCNIQERKALLSPDGDKDKDPLLVNLMDEGQEIISNLRHLNLNPQVCYRDSEPINLYHKVGHGTLDMYVLSPAKDSKEVREFLQKWNQSDQKLFANSKSSREFSFPIQNIISIAALLVWQPANPNDTITRILFPGSSPQRKIFEGLDRLKNLEFIKHPVCTDKSLVPSSLVKKAAKDSIIDKVISKEKISVEKKENKIIENNISQNGDVKEKIVKKSDSTESERSTRTKKSEDKIIENGEKPKAKPKPSKVKSDAQQKRKTMDKKSSPTTPKKTVENGEVKKPTKPSPIGTPAKSTKDANNRKVIESKTRSTKPPQAEPKPKVERKPISRRPKGSMKAPISPVKKLVNGVQKPDTISKKGKLDKEGTTDSSTVSTPSADQESLLKKDISKLTPEEIQQMKAQELADLKEEQEAVKEIEAVFRKGEVQPAKDENLRKVKDISIDEDKLEKEEYLIIEKEEIDHDSLDEKEPKEDETQKLARDSEESEKQRKLSAEEQIIEKQEDIEEQVNNIVNEAEDIVKAKEDIAEVSKDTVVTSPEEKLDVSSTDKKTTDKEIEEEVKDVVESQPDEKVSANIKSGDTTTAPTLPEDERIPLDEIKEDSGQIIEEKHVKEETKEKEVPVIQLPPKTFETISKVPGVVGIRLDKQSHIRDIVKTPDEVADLPVHEEVDYEYTHELKAETKTNEIVEEKKDDKADEKLQEFIKDSEETVGYIKEQAKEIEQEKDKDEVMQEQLQDIIEDINKTTEMHEELKTLTNAVLESEVGLEKDTEKPEEIKDIEHVKLDEQPKKVAEELEHKDLIAEKQDTDKDVPKETSKAHIESQQLQTEDILEKADMETKEKLDVEETTDKEEQKEEKEEEKGIIEKEETEKDKLVAKEADGEKGSAEEKVIQEKEIPKKDVKEIDAESKVQEAKDKPEEVKEYMKEKKVTVKDESPKETKESTIEKVDDKDEDEKKGEKEKINEKKEAERAEPILESEKEKTGEKEEVDKEEPIQDGEIDDRKEVEDEGPIQEKPASKEIVDKELKEEKGDFKDIDEKVDPKKQEIQTDILEEPLVNGEALEEEIKELDQRDSKDQIDDVTDKYGKLEKSDDHKEKVKTGKEVEEIEDTEKESEKKAEPKKAGDVPSVEEVKTQLVKQSEEVIKATKEGKVHLEKIDEKLQHLKEKSPEPKIEIIEPKQLEDVSKTEPSELVKSTKDGKDHLAKLEEKLLELKEAGEHKYEIKKHPEEDEDEKDQKLTGHIIEKVELGRKSPQEREEDVIKIVASVAEVLKSDAPLEEFEGKLPISTTFSPYTATYTTELRETHITTVDSPIVESKVMKIEGIPPIPEEPSSASAALLDEERKTAPIHEGETEKEDKRSSLLKESQELMMATSKMISEIKSAKTEDKNEEKDDEKDDLDESGIVHRMLVTASSEDGGEEIEICPVGTITFSKSSESSGRSSPEKSQELSKKSSIVDTISDSLSTVKQVVELHSEKDSGIDDVKSDTDLESQDKSSPPPENELAKATVKDTGSISPHEKSEEVISRTVSGKSSPDKDASIKSLASGKSTPDMSDFEKSKEITSSFEDLKRTDDLLQKDGDLGTEVLAEEISKAESKAQKDEAKETDSTKGKAENAEKVEEQEILRKEAAKSDEALPEVHQKVEEIEIFPKETAKSDEVIPEVFQKVEDESFKEPRKDSLIEKIEDTIKDQFEAVSDFTKSLFSKGEKESEVVTADLEQKVIELKEEGKEAISKAIEKEDGTIEDLKATEESYIEKIEDKIKETFEAISVTLPSFLEHGDKKLEELTVAAHPAEDAKQSTVEKAIDEKPVDKPEEDLEDITKTSDVKKQDKEEEKVRDATDSSAVKIDDTTDKTKVTLADKLEEASKTTDVPDTTKLADLTATPNVDEDKTSHTTEKGVKKDTEIATIISKEASPTDASKVSDSTDEIKKSESVTNDTKEESTSPAEAISREKSDEISRVTADISKTTDEMGDVKDFSKVKVEGLDKATADDTKTNKDIDTSATKASDILEKGTDEDSVLDKIEEPAKTTTDISDKKSDILQADTTDDKLIAKDSVIEKADETVKVAADSMSDKVEEVSKMTDDKLGKASDIIEKEKIESVTQAQEDTKAIKDSTSEILEETSKDTDKDIIRTDITDTTKHAKEDVKPAEDGSAEDALVDKTKKRRESIVEQFEEGVKSTFSALAGFGKSLFDKGEKVIEDTASKAEHVEDIKTTTESMVEKIDADVKTSIAAVQDFEKSLLESEDKTTKDSTPSADIESNEKYIDVRRDPKLDEKEKDVDGKKVDLSESVTKKLDEQDVHIDSVLSKSEKLSGELTPEEKVHSVVKESISAEPKVPTETTQLKDSAIEIKAVDSKDLKEQMLTTEISSQMKTDETVKPKDEMVAAKDYLSADSKVDESSITVAKSADLLDKAPQLEAKADLKTVNLIQDGLSDKKDDKTEVSSHDKKGAESSITSGKASPDIKTDKIQKVLEFKGENETTQTLQKDTLADIKDSETDKEIEKGIKDSVSDKSVKKDESDLKSETKEDEHKEKEVDIRKATIESEVKEVLRKHSITDLPEPDFHKDPKEGKKVSDDQLSGEGDETKLSGKSSPDLKMEETDVRKLSVSDLKGAKSPSLSGKSTPEIKDLDEHADKKDRKLSESSPTESVSDIKDTAQVAKSDTLDKETKPVVDATKLQEGRKSTDDTLEEDKSGKSTPDKKFDDKGDKVTVDLSNKDVSSDGKGVKSDSERETEGGKEIKDDLKKSANIITDATFTTTDAKPHLSKTDEEVSTPLSDLLTRVVEDEKLLEKEEKILEKSADALLETFEIVSDMAEYIPFDKCETEDEKSVKKEEPSLEKSAQDITEAFEAVSDMAKSVVFDKCEKHPTEVETMDEKSLKKEEETLSKDLEHPLDMSKSLAFDKCGISTDLEEIDPKLIHKDEIQLKESAESLKEAYDTVSKLSNSLSFEKCEKPKDKALEKEEELEGRAEEIKETFDTLTDLSKSVVFEKCDRTDEIDPKLLEKEEIAIKKSAESIKDAYDTVTALSKSLSFEKCEKPEDTILHKEEKELGERAEELKETFETLTDLSKSVVFEKCERTDEIDPKLLEKEEIALKKSAESIKDAYETVTELSKSLSFEKCEKPEDIILHKEEKELEERADGLKQTFETLTDMSKSVVFEKCESPKDKKKSLADELLEKTTEYHKEAFEGVSDTSKSAIFEKCDKDEHKEKSDSEKELFDEKSGKELHAKDTIVKEIIDKVSTDIDTKSISAEIKSPKDLPVASELKAKVSDIAEVLDTVTADLDTKSIEAGFRKSPELLVQDNKLQKSPEPVIEAAADSAAILEKCEKETMEKVTSELKDSKGESASPSEHKELKDLDSKEPLPPLEKEIIKDEVKMLDSRLGEKEILEAKSTLDIAQPEGKKLSISDVEISLADAKVSIDEASAGPKETSTKSIEAERRLSSDEKSEKGDIKDDKQKTESKDTEDSCDKAKESLVSEQIPASIAGPSTLERTKDLSEMADAAELEKQQELQDTLLHEKHIPGAVTPPTVPVSPNIIESYSDEVKLTSRTEALIKEMGLRSSTPGSDDFEIVTSTQSDISSGQVSKVPLDSEKLDSDEEDQLSVTSQVAHSRDSSHYDLEEDTKIGAKIDPMSMSFYGALPEDDTVDKQVEPTYLYEITKAKFASAASSDEADVKLDQINKNKQLEGESLMSASFIGELPSSSTGDAKKDSKDPIESWGKPLGRPAIHTHLYEITQARTMAEGLCTSAIEKEELLRREKNPKKEINYLSERAKASPDEDEDFDLDHINQNEQVRNVMTASFYGSSHAPFGDDKDPIASWGKPLGLPSPAPPSDNKGTPKKERKLPPNVTAKNKLNDDKKRAESPSKYKNKKVNPVYVDLTYVPHHGNSYYSYVDFFKRVRARYYVFSGIEPSRDVYNALLEAKQTWEDKELEVTIIPTYDTDILGYWVAENEELLTKYKIDLSPSASRCTINLQDHETSCSAYRLEF